MCHFCYIYRSDGMVRFLLVFFCLLAIPVMASHIVGGEFEIVHVSGFKYKINLIVYYDEVNGAPGNKQQDQIITARIFRFRDNAFIQDVQLPFQFETNVDYTQPDCSIGALKTSRMFYSTEITMSPEKFGDPEGYYIIWERCCRNYTISNIFSQAPPPNGGTSAQSAGQTFYLKFPPVVRDGQPFVNSSPVLFPPLSDYACINKPYYADFAGTDRDGDSLVYSLVTPLSTHTTAAYPPLAPAPYPEVKWREPFGPNNILNGNPDLKISRDGLLTVKPAFLEGLFVFAVKCEEFRDGVKIGEVRRDFQMLVTDCQAAVPPKITAKQPNGAFTDTAINAVFANTVADEDRCVTVRVTDEDALSQFHNFSEQVKIRAIPIGFKGDVSDVLPSVTFASLSSANPFVDFKICFDKCPHQAGPYQIGIIAADDACSLPLLDTIKINVNIQPPPNERATFLTPAMDVKETVRKGFERIWTITGRDPDGQKVLVEVITDGFKLEDAGFRLVQKPTTADRYEADLIWDTNCEKFDFTEKRNFKIKLLIDDEDQCELKEPDILNFNFTIDLELGNAPVIGSTLTAHQRQNGVDMKIFDNLNFFVFADDREKDELTISMGPNDFLPASYGMSFNPVTGKPVISSPFNWPLLCEKLNLAQKDEFDVTFIARESKTVCKINQADTLTVRIRVAPPDNDKPELTVTQLAPDPPFTNDIKIKLGEEIRLLLTAKDPNSQPQDNVHIDILDVTGNVQPTGYLFSSAEGVGTAETTFTWAPDCSIFENNIYSNDYTFRFVAYDGRCKNVKGDTVSVAMNIQDIESEALEFIPPNIITPNGDGCNDYFAMEGADEGVNESGCQSVLVPNLPKDNCTGKFESIRIYNRWGKEVFQSSQRNFRWLAKDESAGVYFYTIQYTNTTYKGSVTVRF
jgi:hypothetical protein